MNTKKLLLAILALPAPAIGQLPSPYAPQGAPIVVQPGYGVVMPPASPYRLPENPYGTGYSVVTRQRMDRDMTDSETVTSIRPNDAWGNPIKPIWEILEDAGDGDWED